jgi:hypothetical protein
VKRLIPLFLLLACSARAEEARTKVEGRWEYLATNESGSLFYIDASKIADVDGQPGSRRFWLLIDTKTKQIKSEMELSCPNATVLSGPELHYKKSGALLAEVGTWDEKPTPIGAGSVFELVRNYVCNP